MSASDRIQRIVVVFFARHREQLAGVAQAIADAVQRQHDVLQRPLLAAKFLRALGVVPDLRVFEFARRSLTDQLSDRSQRYLRSSLARCARSASRLSMMLSCSASMVLCSLDEMSLD
jgi:hypothetical protein